MRIALIAASLVLVGGTATACGGAPTDASKEDFCASFTKINESASFSPGEEPTKDDIKKVKDAVKDFEETGTPEDIPDDAREGFEIFTEAISDIDDDAAAKDLDEIDDISGDDKKKFDAFGEYVAKTCTE
ncbi:hypothetical protein [Nocardioides sp. cx-173]|uniref:hypothetical protein n=1 Tax=Nocardioides sp. cx-173 TaxID=2898796 RepID=UPI001E2997E7|nr:hypothetical protein [Nocardioides sp. cx-173]MCD4523620.1 hypothetical protein [Nocardioides sp. cx-173]UGB42044.1 hypothetical protein LQ940_00590 [Nocardioides sp. cx-173]